MDELRSFPFPLIPDKVFSLSVRPKLLNLSHYTRNRGTKKIPPILYSILLLPAHWLTGAITMSLGSRSHSTLRARSSDRGNKLTKPSPSSRGVSPAGTNRRVAKLNLYLQRSAKISVEQLQRTADPVRATSRNTDIRRWDGNRRTTIKWDSVRRVSAQFKDAKDEIELKKLMSTCRILSFGSPVVTA